MKALKGSSLIYLVIIVAVIVCTIYYRYFGYSKDFDMRNNTFFYSYIVAIFGSLCVYFHSKYYRRKAIAIMRGQTEFNEKDLKRCIEFGLHFNTFFENRLYGIKNVKEFAKITSGHYKAKLAHAETNYMPFIDFIYTTEFPPINLN